MTKPVLVLWDIDHTLIETRGVGGDLYRAAFEEITGRNMEHKADVTGKTEPAILVETLKLHGLASSEEYQAKYAEALARLYEEHEERLRERGRVLPGAREALAALAEEPGVVQSVLTGNLRAVAEIKLRVFGLDGFVDFEVGAYGDDEADRPKLVAVAQERASAKYGAAFSRDNTVIVGDSPSDVETGLKGGARVIGVASGKSGVEELREAGATAVFQDLTEVHQWLRWIANGDGSQELEGGLNAEEQVRLLVELAERNLREAERCAEAECFHAACVMVGAAIECALLVQAFVFEPELRQADLWKVDKKLKAPLGWRFECLIQVAVKMGWLPLSQDLLGAAPVDKLAGDVGDAVRFVQYARNLAVHPGRHAQDMPWFTGLGRDEYEIVHGIATTVFGHLTATINQLDRDAETSSGPS